MLKKRLGIEAIERGWSGHYGISYYKIPSTLIIPEGCERIGDYTFRCCWDIKRVVIPESVESIGEEAFYDCRGLVKVVILGSVKRISYGAFWGCVGLKKVIIPEGVVKIGRYAFYECERLREVVISESVERIEDWAFGGCPVANIILHKPWSKFEFIATNAFLGCKDVKVDDATVRGFRLLEELLRGTC